MTAAGAGDEREAIDQSGLPAGTMAHKGHVPDRVRTVGLHGAPPSGWGWVILTPGEVDVNAWEAIQVRGTFYDLWPIAYDLRYNPPILVPETLPMSHATVPLTRRGFGETSRRDAWWVQPLVVFLILGGFVVYTLWAALQNAHYTFGPYLSPLYSPVIFGDSPHAWFGPKPGWWPGWVPFSPALIILPFPGLFRLTCYYYRGAYYKAFWADPPGCTVGEPRSKYLGERSFPLVLQNVHRYVLYIAILFIGFLSYDAFESYWFPDPATGGGAVHFGIGLASLVLTANVLCLAGYPLGCHSVRHLAGALL